MGDSSDNVFNELESIPSMPEHEDEEPEERIRYATDPHHYSDPSSHTSIRKEISVLFREPEVTGDLKPSETIRLWKDSLDRIARIYRFVNEMYQQRIEKYTICATIFGSFATTFGSIQLAYGTQNHEGDITIPRIFMFLTVLCSGISTTLAGIIGAHKWVAMTANYTKFISEAEGFKQKIIANIYLPGDIEEKSYRFVEENAEMFSQILSHRPVLKINDVIRAKKSLDNSGILGLNSV